MPPWSTERHALNIEVQISNRYGHGSSKLKCIILGHSFVSRFFLRIRSLFGPKKLSRHAAEYLKVSDYFSNIFIMGRGGARTENFFLPWHTMRCIRPNLVLIDTGSNDLVNARKDIDYISQCVLDLALLIKFTLDCDVVICSVVPRAAGLRRLSEGAFRTRMMRYNAVLSDMVKSSFFGIHFHHHKGFYKIQDGRDTDLPVSAWSEDLIHPSEEGWEKYRVSLRKPMLDYARAKRAYSE